MEVDDYTHRVGTADQVDVTRYGLGARGIDRIEKTTDAYGSSSVTAVTYPIYDGHGNMVRTLARSGAGYSVTAERIFGAWGEVRNGSGPSDSKGKYCANLGHVQDDESGLIYMRARYYEPASGRFVSEDPARDLSNWFSYCSNKPTNQSDPTGREGLWDIGGLLRRAYNLFQNSGRGYGVIETIKKLRAFQESLKLAARVSETAAGQMVSDAEIAAEFNGSEYDADAIAMKIEVVADKEAASVLPLTDALLAKVGIGMIERMLELMLGGFY